MNEGNHAPHKRPHFLQFKLNCKMVIPKPHPEAKLVKLEDAYIFVLKCAFNV